MNSFAGRLYKSLCTGSLLLAGVVLGFGTMLTEEDPAPRAAVEPVRVSEETLSAASEQILASVERRGGLHEDAPALTLREGVARSEVMAGPIAVDGGELLTFMEPALLPEEGGRAARASLTLAQQGITCLYDFRTGNPVVSARAALAEESSLLRFTPARDRVLSATGQEQQVNFLADAVYALVDLIAAEPARSEFVTVEGKSGKGEEFNRAFEEWLRAFAFPRTIVIWAPTQPFVIHNYDSGEWARMAAANAASKEDEGSLGESGEEKLTEDDDDDATTPGQGSSSSKVKTKLAVAPAPAWRGNARALAANEGIGSIANAPETAPSGAISWTGNDSANWNTSAYNWSEGGSATTFSSGDYVFFGEDGRNKNINVTTGQTVSNMMVAGGGYSFSGGGNISVTGTLDIHATGDTTFGSANNITTGTLKATSQQGSETVFGGTVNATTLTLGNSTIAEDGGIYAGSYVFNNSLTVSGAATINLGTSSTDAYSKTLFKAEGAVSAGSLTLAGAAMKTFNGSVTITGDLIISGTPTDGYTTDTRDGLTTFTGAVTIGGDFILKDNASVIFGNNSTLSIGGDLYMEDAVLNFNQFSNSTPQNFGTIHLTGNGAELGFDPLARGQATISSEGTTAYDFTISGNARSFDGKLVNISDLHVAGGAVTISDSSGQLKNSLSVSGGAQLTVQSDNILDSTSGGAGDITVQDAVADFGTTTQTFNGTLHLAGKGTITGSTFNAGSSADLAYSGTGNYLQTTLNLGSMDFVISSEEKGAELSLQGDITGTGNLTFQGAGTTMIQSDLSYTGEIFVQSLLDSEGEVIEKSGATLALNSNNALAAATKITVGEGATLSVIHGGSSVVMNGEGVWCEDNEIPDPADPTGQTFLKQRIGLELESGATLTFTNLNGHDGTPAIALEGGLLFHGNVTFNFIEEDGSNLQNLHTYELITSKTGINAAADSISGVTVIANGKTDPLPSSQYEFGFYIDDQNVRHFTLTMLVGRVWENAAGGEWHAVDANGEYVNWSEGAVGDTALFRTIADTSQVDITFSKQSGARSLYMDGDTSYTITSKLDAGTQAFVDTKAEVDAATGEKPLTTPLFIKKGTGTMTWDKFTATLSDVDIEQGTFALTGNSTLTTTSSIDVAQEGTLSLEKGSTLRQGKATLTAYAEGTRAELRGVTISGLSEEGTTSGSSAATATISGLTGSDGVASAHTISNAAVSGFTVDNVIFTGTGSMQSITVRENVTIASGADYTLGGDMALLSAITNNGTVRVTSDSLIGVGRQDTYVVSDDGFTTTYSPFSEASTGTLVGWTSLGAENFRVRGTNLDRIVGITVTTTADGKVVVSGEEGNVKFLRWDSEFNPDSWETPTVGLNYSTTGRSDLNIVSTRGNAINNTYAYSSRVEGGRSDTYVINLASGSGRNNYDMFGVASNAAAKTSESAPIHVWINDEGSLFNVYVAGTTSDTYYGDTHLQITGALANATTIIGASQNATQYGDSYLTIEAGSYSGDTIVAGSYGANHYGDSSLHITGGTYGTVYGGSYSGATLEGDTRVIVDGGTISDIYGGDYNTSTAHTGNVTIDLRGGTVTNVYAAGGNTVSGNAHIRLYADEKGAMGVKFGDSAVLDGGISSISGGGHSALSFVDAGSYDLTDVTIRNFSHLEMSQGANVSAEVTRFNATSDLIITGPGVLTLTGSTSRNKNADLTVTGGAKLILDVEGYSGHGLSVYEMAAIRVENGSTLDVTDHPRGSGINYSMDLYLAGDGVDGKGALYKSNSADGSTKTQVSLYRITLTDHASAGNGWGGSGSSSICMIPYQVTTYAGKLDLLNGTQLSKDNRGFIFTKQGSDEFAMYNVDVKGGTINLVGGTLFTDSSSSAGNTDIVLHRGTTLSFGGSAGFLPETDDNENYDMTTASVQNGLAVESLSGEGTVDLNSTGSGSQGWLYINMDQGYTDFTEDFSAEKALADGRQFYNDKGYSYAVYSGKITGAGLVTKLGGGTQTFAGSESDYTGNTYAAGGRLYLTGTSTASEFVQSVRDENGFVTNKTEVAQGVIGKGQLQWQGGEVYLADGVRIYNSSQAVDNTGTVIIGVEGGDELTERGANGELLYNSATYSGMIATDGNMMKRGKGMLTFDQLGRFGGGITIEAGTLNLCGWADADAAVISQTAGSSLMNSYDGSNYSGEEEKATEENSSALAACGSGDVQWTADNNYTGGDTAAIISAIGLGRTLTLSGAITDGAEAGNLLHSGEGTLILSGATESKYSGGTTITDGVVRVQKNTGLGATAAGKDANVLLSSNARLEIMDVVATTATTTEAAVAAQAVEVSLAAVAEGTYDGNDLRGTVAIGSGAENAKTARLNMDGDGYYAARTELAANGVLVFRGADSSNWDGQFNSTGTAPASTEDMAGAGTLAGSGTVVVSDAAGEGTSVYFQVTDAMGAGSNGFSGDLVVEGDNTLLHVQGGAIDGGNFSISGNGARIDAQRSTIAVREGKTVSLSSLGDQDRDANSVAELAALSVEVQSGGTLAVVKKGTEYAFNDGKIEAATQLSLYSALAAYDKDGDSRGYHYAAGSSDDVTNYAFHYNNLVAYNTSTTGVLNTIDGVVLNGGSTYEMMDANISMSGTPLTLNVTNSVKITIAGGVAFNEYQELLKYAGTRDDILTGQWVLFSDVTEFQAMVDGVSLINGIALTDAEKDAGAENQIYVTQANKVFTSTYMDDSGNTVDIADNILLVYDAGAQVVYLDRTPNAYSEIIPEPSTATLSLLALTALMARRRRK